MIISKRIDIWKKKINNVIIIAFAAVDGQQQENKERSQKDIFGRRRLDQKKMAKMFNIEDWEKTTIKEVKMRWGNRRREIEEIKRKKREIEEIKRKKREIEEKIEIRKKKKEEKRKRVIRERRCFVCGIFGHMAHYYRIRKEKKRSTQIPLYKFEILRDRVMQRGEGSGREIVKDKREILKEEKAKREKKRRKVQKNDLENKKEKKIDDKKEKIEKEKRK